MAAYLGEFEHLLLLALLRLGDDAYTASIRGVLEDWTRRSVSPGAIYTALERLERRGFVQSKFGEPTPERGGKRKKFYRLRPAGSAALRASQETIQRVSSQLASKLRSL
ncbi:MAG TPA: helix-turn-helix transcriptional regulator [Vicinamibacterales bacterium]|nr:helix-turn-helix transcriptional regulator [Vicinamibacterales bacterium]